ncbi:MAG: hypothetical protein M1833_002256 [Piccolia ochrophora]|nr:MAG: hypothetical protein M1833_002256 [Piccolia ochrophora]
MESTLQRRQSPQSRPSGSVCAAMKAVIGLTVPLYVFAAVLVIWAIIARRSRKRPGSRPRSPWDKAELDGTPVAVQAPGPVLRSPEMEEVDIESPISPTVSPPGSQPTSQRGLLERPHQRPALDNVFPIYMTIDPNITERPKSQSARLQDPFARSPSTVSPTSSPKGKRVRRQHPRMSVEDPTLYTPGPAASPLWERSAPPLPPKDVAV